MPWFPRWEVPHHRVQAYGLRAGVLIEQGATDAVPLVLIEAPSYWTRTSGWPWWECGGDPMLAVFADVVLNGDYDNWLLAGEQELAALA